MNPKRFWLMGLAVLLAGMSAVAVVPARAEDPFCFECHDDFPKKMKAFKFTHDPAAGGGVHRLPPRPQGRGEAHARQGRRGPLLRLPRQHGRRERRSTRRWRRASAPAATTPTVRRTRNSSSPPGSALCEKCHAASPEFKGQVTHAAIDDGCSDCHRPHASENMRLLTKNLVMDRLALFDPKQAELCLGCHDLETFTKTQTEDTGFRMGTMNLHALHLNGGAVPNKYGIIKKKDGQTCFACHLPHTAHSGEAAAHRVPVHGHLLLHDALCPEHQRGDLHRRLPQAEDVFAGGTGPERDGRHRPRGEAGRPLAAAAAPPRPGSMRAGRGGHGFVDKPRAPSRL